MAILGQEARQQADEPRVVLDEEQVHGATPGRRPGTSCPGPGEERQGVGDRDREADPLAVAGRGDDDPDHDPGRVEERPAAAPRVDRGVGLDEALEGDPAAGGRVLQVDRPVQPGDDARGDRVGELAEGAPDGDHELADGQAGAGPDPGRGQPGRLGAEQDEPVGSVTRDHRAVVSRWSARRMV